MNTFPNKEQFEQAAAELAVAPAMVEKDWHVAQVLACLAGQQFRGLSNAEKFEQMLAILTQDAEYRREYDQFVKGVSYAPEGAEPDYDSAMETVERLLQLVLAANI